MSILIGLAHEPVFNAAVATQIVFQQPAIGQGTARPIIGVIERISIDVFVGASLPAISSALSPASRLLRERR
ncbi:hypothetical protein EQ831_21170 [Pseudomonas sp. ALS1279]|nr:hypothetical protein EQ831_21170 [Pseudomonas sp. ALS1279]